MCVEYPGASTMKYIPERATDSRVGADGFMTQKAKIMFLLKNYQKCCINEL